MFTLPSRFPTQIISPNKVKEIGMEKLLLDGVNNFGNSIQKMKNVVSRIGDNNIALIISENVCWQKVLFEVLACISAKFLSLYTDNVNNALCFAQEINYT